MTVQPQPACSDTRHNALKYRVHAPVKRLRGLWWNLARGDGGLHKTMEKPVVLVIQGLEGGALGFVKPVLEFRPITVQAQLDLKGMTPHP